MARLVVILAAALAALWLLLRLALNFNPLDLPDAVDVATGLGAKLACSARYLSGFDAARISDDLASYSPAFGYVELEFDPATRSATASLAGIGSGSARYRPGLGCTLDLAGAPALDRVGIPPLATTAAPWPRGNGPAAIAPELQDRLDTLLLRDNDAGYQTRALAVVRGDRLVAESYAEGIGRDTPLLGWSMGKSVTAMLLGIAERDGLVADADRQLFEPWQRDERSDISLRNLLQMSSGLAFEENYSPGHDATRMLSAAPSAAAVALQKPLLHPPGRHFSYSSGTTNLLALLLQQRLGGSTQQAIDFLYGELLAPLGLAHTVLEPDPSGVFVGSSYVYASARDWAKLGLLMLRRGDWFGRRILGDDWVARATAANASENDPRYGYQFWLNSGGSELRWPELPADAYAMQGNREQIVMIIPSLDTIIVRLGWSAIGYPRSEKFAALLAP